MSRQLFNDNGFEEAMKSASPVKQASTSPNSNPELNGDNHDPQGESKPKNGILTYDKWLELEQK